MQRLIDANALKESVHAHDYVLKDCLNSTDKGMFTVGIMQAIDEQPTIDAEPVRHGKWIFTKYCTWECSECKRSPTKGTGYIQSKDELFEFCPNCGARMDK